MTRVVVQPQRPNTTVQELQKSAGSTEFSKAVVVVGQAGVNVFASAFKSSRLSNFSRFLGDVGRGMSLNDAFVSTAACAKSASSLYNKGFSLSRVSALAGSVGCGAADVIDAVCFVSSAGFFPLGKALAVLEPLSMAAVFLGCSLHLGHCILKLGQVQEKLKQAESLEGSKKEAELQRLRHKEFGHQIMALRMLSMMLFGAIGLAGAFVALPVGVGFLSASLAVSFFALGLIKTYADAKAPLTRQEVPENHVVWNDVSGDEVSGSSEPQAREGKLFQKHAEGFFDRFIDSVSAFFSSIGGLKALNGNAKGLSEGLAIAQEKGLEVSQSFKDSVTNLSYGIFTNVELIPDATKLASEVQKGRVEKPLVIAASKVVAGVGKLFQVLNFYQVVSLAKPLLSGVSALGQTGDTIAAVLTLTSSTSSAGSLDEEALEGRGGQVQAAARLSGRGKLLGDACKATMSVMILAPTLFSLLGHAFKMTALYRATIALLGLTMGIGRTIQAFAAGLSPHSVVPVLVKEASA
jgi:hypothetical protein